MTCLNLYTARLHLGHFFCIAHSLPRLSLSVCLTVFLNLSLSVCLSVYIYIYISLSLSCVCMLLSFSHLSLPPLSLPLSPLSVSLSPCLVIYLSVYLPIDLFIEGLWWEPRRLITITGSEARESVKRGKPFNISSTGCCLAYWFCLFLPLLPGIMCKWYWLESCFFLFPLVVNEYIRIDGLVGRPKL